jgi:hypothetical protein
MDDIEVTVEMFEAKINVVHFTPVKYINTPSATLA